MGILYVQARPGAHGLSDIDPQGMTGVCTICGPVAVKRRAAHNGRWRYYCRVKESQDIRRQKSRHHGLNMGEREAMIVAAGGACAICYRAVDARTARIDHCHKTGRIRGVLCTGCNALLGRVKDDPAVGARIYQYLTA